MNDFLNKMYGDNSLQDYFWVAGVILFVLFLNRFISKYIALLLCKLIRRQWKTFDQQKFVQLIIHPLGTFLVITVSIIALYRLNFPPDLNVTLYKYPMQKIVQTIGVIIQVVAFIWFILRIIDFIASLLAKRAEQTPEQNDNQLIVFFRDFLKVVVGIMGFMMILYFAFNYNIGSILTGLSIVGAAIALALRESLENLIASFVIFFDKPFTTGDFVRVQNIAGSVERIGLRSTRIRTTDKSYVTVPNKQMVDSILDNVTLRSQIRGEINLHINLQTPPEKIEQLTKVIRDYLGQEKTIQNYNVLFNDIRMQAFIIFVEFFTPAIPWNEFTSLKQKLNFHILQAMEKLEIRIAAEGKDIAITP